MRKMMAAMAFTFILGSGWATVAQAQTGGTSGGGQGSSYGSTTSGDQGDRGHNWGWIGLLGLAGLAGLRRHENVGSTRTTDTRATATR